MGPITQILYNQASITPKLQAYMLTSHHFLTSWDFMQRVLEISMAFPVIEFTDKMPQRDMFIEVVDSEEGALYILGPDTTLDGVIAISASRINPDTGQVELESLGHWRPRTSTVGLTKERREKLGNLTDQELNNHPVVHKLWSVAAWLSTFVELVNEPRLVERSSPPRAMRRRLARQLSAQGHEIPTTFVSVGWTIGDKTTPKGNVPPEVGGHKAFHMVRGHWRDYGDRHTPKAERRPGRPGWWVWIDWHWSGNPAYGVIGHSYRPKIDREKSARVILDLAQSRTPV